LHEHDVPLGQPVPEHSHEFQIAHEHSGPQLPPALMPLSSPASPWTSWAR
jgi:hypothetical protein